MAIVRKHLKTPNLLLALTIQGVFAVTISNAVDTTINQLWKRIEPY